MKAKEINQEIAKKLFTYNEEGFLVWNKLGRTHSREGKKVGSLQKSGYYRATVNGQNVNVHRLIYVYHHGDIPSDIQIDHIDRDKSNNKIENLRAVSASENQWNSDISKVKGYSYSKRDKLYQARIKVGGKLILLGCFKKKEDARDAYAKAKAKYHQIRK